MYFSGKLPVTETKKLSIHKKVDTLIKNEEVAYFSIEELFEHSDSILVKRQDDGLHNTLSYTSTIFNDIDVSKIVFLFKFRIENNTLNYVVSLKESKWILAIGAYTLVLIGLFQKVTQGHFPFIEVLIVFASLIYSFRLAKEFALDMIELLIDSDS